MFRQSVFIDKGSKNVGKLDNMWEVKYRIDDQIRQNKTSPTEKKTRKQKRNKHTTFQKKKKKNAQ